MKDNELIDLRKQLVEAISSNDTEAISRIRDELTGKKFVVRTFFDLLIATSCVDDYGNEVELDFEIEPGSAIDILFTEIEEREKQEKLNSIENGK